jgi:hypothetical protein
MAWSLRRWWMDLFRARSRPATPDPVAEEPRAVAAGSSGDVGDDGARRPPRPPRHYTAPPAHEDPQRETHLGAVLQALAGGPRSRADLGREVGAADWGPGRVEAVVDHGLATGVLVEGADGTVRARYAD